MNPEKIIISRTDNLGDVMLTLPMAGIIKEKYPSCKIYFIGKSYTKALIETCKYIDEFVDKENVLNNDYLNKIKADVIIHVFPDKAVAKAAAKAKIPFRIGTSHRWFHWLYCNKKVNFSRKKSSLHEAQLNLKLLQPLGVTKEFSLPEINGNLGFEKIPQPSKEIALNKEKFNLVFHPKSKGSAREWPMEYYFQLANLLPVTKYSIYITGTEKEGELIKSQKKEIFDLPHVIDTTGKCSLEELVNLIARADGLVACSTGPLHIASSLGKFAVGIYPPMKPIHPGRWAPIGKNSTVLVEDKFCEACRVNSDCSCIRAISPEQVVLVVDTWKK